MRITCMQCSVGKGIVSEPHAVGSANGLQQRASSIGAIADTHTDVSRAYRAERIPMVKNALARLVDSRQQVRETSTHTPALPPTAPPWRRVTDRALLSQRQTRKVAVENAVFCASSSCAVPDTVCTIVFRMKATCWRPVRLFGLPHSVILAAFGTFEAVRWKRFVVDLDCMEKSFLNSNSLK